MKKIISLLMSLVMLVSTFSCFALPTNASESSNSTERYSVLILDDSGSMSGKPMTVQKQSAKKFCNSVLKSKGINKVAIIRIDSPSSKLCDFTDDLSLLTSKIDSLSANGGTNIYSALSLAEDLLDSAPKSAIKNLVVCSDGLPCYGKTESSGKYTRDDNSSYYAYANSVYNKSQDLMDKYDSNFHMYSLGFFHSLSGDNLIFGRVFMNDIQNSGYYEVTNVDDLEFAFDEISKDYTKNDFISDDKPFKGKHGYCYSDSYFDQPATKYNQSLATMSLCLAFSTYSKDDEVKNKDNNTEKMLKECGYDKYEQYHFNEKPERESIGCAIASKEYNGNTIIAVAVRSGGYAAEWASNLKLKSVGGNGKNDHEGFDKSSDKVETYIMQYIQSKNITGNVKIWITGFSRGAAVATQTAAKLQNGLAYVKDGTYVSAEFDKNSVYAYGFATPAGAIKDNKPNSSKYNNIFNIIEYNDPVPLIAPERWDYTRYGQTRVLPFRESTDSKKYNKYIKQIKKEMGDDWKVDEFQNYIFNLLAQENTSNAALVNPLNKDTLGTYNRKLIKTISKSIGSSDKYYKKYQSDIMDFAAKYKGKGELDITIILGQLVRLLPTAFMHKNLTTTLVENKSILADVHANQKYYLYWMQLMDKNYSNNLPTLFTDGDFRKIIVNCPVDINVYDSNNTLVASIINDEPQEIEDSSIVSSVDDNNQKVVYLPQDEEYRVEVTSREDCQTTYTIEELAGVNSDVSRVVTYDSLAMKQGDTITSTINRYTQDEIDNVVDNGSSADYKTKLNNQVVSSDVDAKGSEVEKYTYNVTVTSNSEDCSAVGSGTFNIGEFAQVEAVPAANYTFDGWYIDGKKVSSDASYRFAVKSNVNIEAKFINKNSGSSVSASNTTETKPNQTQNTSTSATQKLSIKKLVSKKKALAVYWNKIANVSGYQIQIATDKKFKKNKKTVTVAKQNASKKTVKKLKSKKKYYVRVRTYKVVNGKKVYGKWSKVKSVKTK